jgi:hypothetical protein
MESLSSSTPHAELRARNISSLVRAGCTIVFASSLHEAIHFTMKFINPSAHKILISTPNETHSRNWHSLLQNVHTISNREKS